MAKKKIYSGVVIVRFGFKDKKYIVGDLFKTTDKEVYDNLINIKKIK